MASFGQQAPVISAKAGRPPEHAGGVALRQPHDTDVLGDGRQGRTAQSAGGHNAEAVAQKRGGEVLVAVLAGQVGDRHQVTDMLDEQHKRDGGDDQDTVQAPGGQRDAGQPDPGGLKHGREVHIAERAPPPDSPRRCR